MDYLQVVGCIFCQYTKRLNYKQIVSFSYFTVRTFWVIYIFIVSLIIFLNINSRTCYGLIGQTPNFFLSTIIRAPFGPVLGMLSIVWSSTIVTRFIFGTVPMTSLTYAWRLDYTFKISQFIDELRFVFLVILIAVEE